MVSIKGENMRVAKLSLVSVCSVVCLCLVVVFYSVWNGSLCIDSDIVSGISTARVPVVRFSEKRQTRLRTEGVGESLNSNLPAKSGKAIESIRQESTLEKGRYDYTTVDRSGVEGKLKSELNLAFQSEHYASDHEGANETVESKLSVNMDGYAATEVGDTLNQIQPQVETDYSSNKGTEPGANIEALVEKCMLTTHLITSINDSSPLIKQAKRNAKYLYQEYREVIPAKSLSGYRSHCWKAQYTAMWSKHHFLFQVANSGSFFGKREDFDQTYDVFANLREQRYQGHSLNASLLCLPKLFLAGFPKCGSSYTYCLVNKILRLRARASSAVKEPHFWIVNGAGKLYYEPSASDVGRYLFYYLPVLKHIPVIEDVVLFDASADKMFKWPRFNRSDHDLANYCLLPSLIPQLIPGSKFIVVLRSPLTMLYSTFWYSCSRREKTVSMAEQLKGPKVFHERIVSKINQFNNCMKDYSIPSISYACQMGEGHNYSACILQEERLHLLDKCTHEIANDKYYDKYNALKDCGRIRVAMGLYYVHIRKWLSVVPRDQLLILTLKDMNWNLTGTFHNIADFLQVERPHRKRWMQFVSNRCGKYTQSKIKYKDNPKLFMKTDTKKLLLQFYKPFNKLLSELLQKKLPSSW